ncbi:MAG: hypothetical protein PVJ67_02750 [Candidatus Pacearchaeota archaeon]|jgi:hypothetical protein
MKIYEIEQADIDAMWNKAKELARATSFEIPSLSEVGEALLKNGSFEQRICLSSFPESKIKARKKCNGDVWFEVQTNMFRETPFSKKYEKEFNKFANDYVSFRTRRGLP